MGTFSLSLYNLISIYVHFYVDCSFNHMLLSPIPPHVDFGGATQCSDMCQGGRQLKSRRTLNALDDEVEALEALWVDTEMTVLNNAQ